MLVRLQRISGAADVQFSVRTGLRYEVMAETTFEIHAYPSAGESGLGEAF